MHRDKPAKRLAWGDVDPYAPRLPLFLGELIHPRPNGAIRIGGGFGTGRGHVLQRATARHIDAS